MVLYTMACSILSGILSMTLSASSEIAIAFSYFPMLT